MESHYNNHDLLNQATFDQRVQRLYGLADSEGKDANLRAYSILSPKGEIPAEYYGLASGHVPERAAEDEDDEKGRVTTKLQSSQHLTQNRNSNENIKQKLIQFSMQMDEQTRNPAEAANIDLKNLQQNHHISTSIGLVDQAQINSGWPVEIANPQQ